MCTKCPLCNILAAIFYISNDMYQICAKAVFNGKYMCAPNFLVRAISRPVRTRTQLAGNIGCKWAMSKILSQGVNIRPLIGLLCKHWLSLPLPPPLMIDNCCREQPFIIISSPISRLLMNLHQSFMIQFLSLDTIDQQSSLPHGKHCMCIVQVTWSGAEDIALKLCFCLTFYNQ